VGVKIPRELLDDERRLFAIKAAVVVASTLLGGSALLLAIGGGCVLSLWSLTAEAIRDSVFVVVGTWIGIRGWLHGEVDGPLNVASIILVIAFGFGLLAFTRSIIASFISLGCRPLDVLHYF